MNENDFYLLVNEGEHEIKGDLYISTVGRVELWDPWEGQIDATCVKVYDDHIGVDITLERRQSVFLVVYPTQMPDNICDNNIQRWTTEIKELDKGWNIYREDEKIDEKNMFLSWTQWPNMEDYSGIISYKTFFHIENMDDLYYVELDLGEVNEIAHVFINGLDASFRMWAPYKFDITAYLKKGQNNICIKVINTLANKINNAKLASGLLGPIRIKLYKK